MFPLVTSKYVIGLILLSGGVLASGRQAYAFQLSSALRDCATLDDCLKAVDKADPPSEGSTGPREEAIAMKFVSFGEPAKRALLQRAAGPYHRRRDFAQSILESWPSWTPADVPELRAALQKEHGGWMARPLATIATPAAIEALVEDLPKSNSGNQTDSSLQELASKAIPYLTPLLEQKATASIAQEVIRKMEPLPIEFAASWTALAKNTQKPLPERMAALRGIAALGSAARLAADSLLPLLHDAESSIQGETALTLKAVHHPAVVVEVARSCQPKADRFDDFPIDSVVCLREIAYYGKDGYEAGPYLLSFLASQNAVERQSAISTLAAVGYSPAAPQLQEALRSPDWRIAYAAARGLGWLGVVDALPQLEETASSHWLPEVRAEAQRAANAIASPAHSLPQVWIPYADREGETFWIDAGVLADVPKCSRQRWIWQGRTFSMPARLRNGKTGAADSALPFDRGKLIGTDNGEFGGNLIWKSGKQKQEIHKDDVNWIVADDGAAIVLFGLSHLGLRNAYVLRITRAPDGRWDKNEIARLPAGPGASVIISPGLFATYSGGRVVVFTRQGIQGLATCSAF